VFGSRIFNLLSLFILSALLPVSVNAGDSNNDFFKIAVIDTGCDFDHPLLESYVRLPSLRDGKDETGHGTHIAGIIVRGLQEKKLDKKLEIVPIKFFETSDSDSELTKSFAHALRRAIDLDVQIIHVSAGGPQPSDLELNLLLEAQRKGILVVAAAGNKRPKDPTYSFYPAAYPLDHVISVVGTDQRGNRLLTSNINYGKKNLYFPGENILSSLPGERFGRLTGSSQAAAKATVLIASLWISEGQAQAFKKLIPDSSMQANNKH
jgi:subtilisin family serine protease